MKRTACLSFDFEALKHNLDIVRQSCKNSRIMAVIKADAYGHGMLQVADRLGSVDAVAVACVDEAVALREHGYQNTIVVLQGFQQIQQLQQCVELGLDPVIHQLWQINLLDELDTSRPALSVWLKLDTGMHRLGISPDLAEQAWQRLQHCQSVDQLHLMSHLANADVPANPYNQQQHDLFDHWVRKTELDASLANSAAILTNPQSHYDWVRPGLMLYGVSPIEGQIHDQYNLQPVMRLSTRLIAIQQLKKGQTVGYGGNWVCPEDMMIGVAAIGYGDGYPRHATNGTPVWISGRRCQLVGRVSMDMITIDLSKHEQAMVGDEVVLWGPELAVEEVAESSGTIAYELLCHAGAHAS